MRAEARYWLFILCAWIHWNVLPGEYCLVLICTHAQDIFNKHQELCLACQIAHHENCMWVCKSHYHVVCCVFVFDSYWYMFHRFQKNLNPIFPRLMDFQIFFWKGCLSQKPNVFLVFWCIIFVKEKHTPCRRQGRIMLIRVSFWENPKFWCVFAMLYDVILFWLMCAHICCLVWDVKVDGLPLCFT